MFFLLLFPILGNAQAYEIESKSSDDGWYYCHTKDFEQNILLQLHVNEKYVTYVSFGIFRNTNEGGENLKDYDKSSTFKLNLSNGEILTYAGGFNSLVAALGKFDISCSKFGSNKKNLTGEDDGYYVLTQLRKYNITKISIASWSKSFSKFRSAATFDAMCKKLKRETGLNNAHFGASPTESSNSSSASSSSSSSRGSSASSNSGYGSNRTSALQTSKDGNMDILALNYFMLDERGVTTPSDFNIFNQIQLTVRNARGKKVWVEFKYVNADNHSALRAVNSNYCVSNNAAGKVISFVPDSDNYTVKEYAKVPVGSLGLGNGNWNIMVMPFVYVGEYKPNLPSSTLGPIKVLHFSKYGQEVGNMTVTDYNY